MPIQTVAESDLRYHLISYDKRGREREDDPDASTGRLSEAVLDEVVTQPVTDVFLMSHGWQGDVPAAIEQYNDWAGAMAKCPADIARMREARPGFRPLLIGLHWPSLPWGEEDLSDEVSFAASEEEAPDPMASAAESIADTPRAQEALITIFASAVDDIAPDRLPQEAVDAYQALFNEAGLSCAGPNGAPGADADNFDPQALYLAAADEEDMVSFGASGLGGLLAPLRTLSFWQMKKRARTFGESGAATLLRKLQHAGPQVRFHLMGHSFGCIVVSSAIAGAGGDQPLVRPIDTAILIQGALSLWSYCSDIPATPGSPGYFHSIPRDGKVAGPLLTTQSRYDTAVGTLYPMAAGVASQVSFAEDELPRYGALGTYGVQGPGVDFSDISMLNLDGTYEFRPRKAYNLDADTFIREGGGMSGAHSDIAKPEVAHAFWEAILTSGR